MDSLNLFETDLTRSFTANGVTYTNEYTKTLFNLGLTDNSNFLEPYYVGWIPAAYSPSFLGQVNYKYSADNHGKTYTFESDFTRKNQPITLIAQSNTSDGVSTYLRWDETNARWQIYNNATWDNLRLINKYEAIRTVKAFGTQINFVCWKNNTTTATHYFSTPVIVVQDNSVSDIIRFFNGDAPLKVRIVINNTNVDLEFYLSDFVDGIATFTYDDGTDLTDFKLAVCSMQFNNGNNGSGYTGDVSSINPIIYYDSDGIGDPILFMPRSINTLYSASSYGLQLNISTNVLTNNGWGTINGYYQGGFNGSFSTTEFVDAQRRTFIPEGANFVVEMLSGSTTPNLRIYRIFDLKELAHYLSQWPRFTTSSANVTFDSADAWYPIYTSDGATTGKFVNGADPDLLNKLQTWQQSDIADNVITKDDIPVTPVPSDDGENDTRKRNDVPNLPEISGIRLVSGTGFSSFYLLSAYHVSELGNLLSQMPSTFWEALGTATDYKMSNILDYISALKWYPINIAASAPALYPDVQTSDIQFGFNGVAKVTLSSAGTSYKLGTVNRVFDMGSVYIPYRASQQTFLDIEPYTDVYANLPYIGKVQLQANQVLGYTITCYYIIDLITGIATCFLDNGYDTIYTGAGKIGVDISVSGNDVITQSERMSTAYVGTVTHAISNALSIGGNVAAENPAGALVGTGNMISGLVADSIAAANAKRGVPQVVSGGSGFGSTYANQYPAIIVQRPAVKIPSGYGHSVGYIYNTRSRISAISGYTVCDNPDLSGIVATSAELDMIKSILTTGFYA